MHNFAVPRFMAHRFLPALAALVLILATRPAQAQQWGVYFTGSGDSLRVNNTNNLYGSTFGLYVQTLNTPVVFGADFRGVITGTGNVQGAYTDERLDYGLFGPRVATKPIRGRIIPYAEGLVGLAYFREGVGILRQDKSSGSLQAVGGVDVKVYHHIQWRAIDASYGRARGQLYATHPLVLSTGILFQFP